MRFRISKLILTLLSGLLLIVTAVSTSYAVLSANTAKTIEGSKPYLTFDGGTTKATDTDGLLGITLSDGRVYTKQTNKSTASNPIELPVQGQSFSDVKTVLPAGLMTANLSALISAPYNKWGDDDGDGQNGGVSATGSLSMTLKDVENNSVSLTDVLSGCNSPYTLTLTSTAGNLTTQYGVPNQSTFTASSTTYYLKPKIDEPYACWAQPNLDYGDSASGFWDPAYKVWDPKKGFVVPTALGTPNSHFPTTGFDGAFFNLTVAGALGSDVKFSKSPASSGLDLTITGSDNIAKVSLTGPKHGATSTTAATAVPTTFTLYSDAAKTNVIYTFKVNHWFIVRPGYSGGYASSQAYCAAFGSGYSIPSVSDFTNANGFIWTGGLAGQGNGYQRRVGGGLFAEWGYTDNGYYEDSDFVSFDYWTRDLYNGDQYTVFSDTGRISYASGSSLIFDKAACVK